MKKIAFLLAAIATLTSNGLSAQMPAMGSAAQSGASYSTGSFAWGIGLGALAVVGVVVGVTAGASASSASNPSH